MLYGQPLPAVRHQWRYRVGEDMESEKTKWVKKYAARALDSWRRREHAVAVSEEYRTQLESDLTKQYDDLLKRQFIEATWAI